MAAHIVASFYINYMNLRRFIAFTLIAIDLQPNDIAAPLPDKSRAMISYPNAENGTFYKNGAAVSTKPFGSPDIATQSAIARISTSYNYLR